MTRKWFLSLLGIGAAGQTKIPAQSGVDVDYVPARPKPKNGECPVCGTMAPKYFAQSARVLTSNPPIYVPGEPDSKIIRCTHCNAAFWQDAEGVK